MKTKGRTQTNAALILAALLMCAGQTPAQAQLPRATPMPKGNEQGFASFEKNVFPVLNAVCANCHNADNENVPWHVNSSDPKETYRIVRRYVRDFGDLKHSTLATAPSREIMLGASFNVDGFVTVLKKWWEDGENMAFLEGKKVLLQQKIPVFPKSAPVSLQWDLGEADTRFIGVLFKVEIQKVNGGYRLSNPKIDAGRDPIEVQGVHVLLNGIWNVAANSYASVHTVVPRDGILSHAVQNVIAAKGEGLDELSFAFEKLEPSMLARPTVSPDLALMSTPAKQQSMGAVFDEKEVGKAARFVAIDASAEHPVIYEMGASERAGNEARHWVAFEQAFEIQATPVTQLQWYFVMRGVPSAFRDKMQCDPTSISQPPRPAMCMHHPVEMVSWIDAQKFISELNKAQGLDCGDTTSQAGFEKAYKTPGCYRLPTEAEWEYVAHVGLPPEYAYGWGGDFDAQYAWYNGNSQNRTHEVATRTPTPSPQDARDQLWDMTGNVQEWVQDLFDNYPPAKDPKNPSVDPMNLAKGTNRVLRGGSYLGDGPSLRVTRRFSFALTASNGDVGFRLARTAPGEASPIADLPDDLDALKEKKADEFSLTDVRKVFDRLLRLSKTPSEVFEALSPGVVEPSSQRLKLISDLAMARFEHFSSLKPSIADFNRYKAYARDAKDYELIATAAVRTATSPDEFFEALKAGAVLREDVKSAAGEIAATNASVLAQHGGTLDQVIQLKSYAHDRRQYQDVTVAALSITRTPIEFFHALEPAPRTAPTADFIAAGNESAAAAVGHLAEIGGKITDLNRLKPLTVNADVFRRITAEAVKLAKNPAEFFLALDPSLPGGVPSTYHQATVSVALEALPRLAKMSTTPEDRARMRSYAGDDIALRTEVDHAFGGDLSGVRDQLNAMKDTAQGWDEQVAAFTEALKLAKAPIDFFVALESGVLAPSTEREALIRRLAMEKIDLLVKLGGGPAEIPKMLSYARNFADQVIVFSHLAASSADFDTLKVKATTWDDKFRVYSAALALAKSPAEIEAALSSGKATPDRETTSIVDKLAIQAASKLAASGASSDSILALRRFASSQSGSDRIERIAQSRR